MLQVFQTETYKKWFATLKDTKTRAKINVRIRRLMLGNLGDFKTIGEGIFEIRIDFGPGYRVYFLRKQNTLVILLAGGDKSTQVKDIQKAKDLARSMEE